MSSADMRHDSQSSRRRWLARVSLAAGAAAVLVFATVSGVKGLLWQSPSCSCDLIHMTIRAATTRAQVRTT
jgi:hypothetical protein